VGANSRSSAQPRRQGGVGGDEQDLGAGVVLGLAQQVGRDPGGVGSGIGDHHQLGRAGGHVDGGPPGMEAT
jgi:hypothetical protein